METANAIDARSAVETRCSGTVVNVHGTVLSCPSIHTNTVVRAQRISARGPVVTDAGPHGAFVHIHFARIACPLGWTRARITVDAVHARTTIKTGVGYAVVHILFAVLAAESCKKETDESH